MKKRFSVISLLMLAVLLGLAACARLPEAKPVPDAGETPGGFPMLRLGESNACYILQIDYPRLGDERIDRKILNWVKDNYASSTAEFNALCAHVTPKQPFRQWVSYELQLTPGAVSVVFTTLIYAGGEQYHDKIDARSYLRQNGAELGYNDIFTKPEDLTGALRASVKDSLAPDLRGIWAENPEYLSALESEQVSFSNFAIIEEGLRLYFPTRQIAPFYAGPQQCIVPLGALAPFGPRPEIWE